MDKNTTTGLVLIAILLIGFSYFSRPSKEQIAAQQRYYDSIAQVNQRDAALQAEADKALALEEARKAAEDTTATFYNVRKGTDATYTIKNDLITLSINAKGGSLASVELSQYKEQDKQSPVKLFSEADIEQNFIFTGKGEVIKSADYYFQPVAQTDSCITMRLAASTDRYIDFSYALHKDSYLVDFSIKATGMSDLLAAGSPINIDWKQRTRQIEKGYTYENRLSELTYKTLDGDVENLSAGKSDKEQEEKGVNWIAYKNQFFSTVLINDAGFQSTTFTSDLEEKNSGYIKRYTTETQASFDAGGQEATRMFYYFGPNHYKTLSSISDTTDNDWELNRLVYLGWPLLRWVNRWFTINLFDWLSSLGLSMGLVLLLMTIIVKIVIYPTTKKTFLSSAKMRVLKPKIDALKAKYPKQEDAMQKQQEIMQIYSQYGVSPMGGCLPMIIQFPILMALFMFVPSAIELRQQSFLWADDLSTYDALVTFPFNIPFLGNHISIFCLLMTITNILNTKYMMQQQDNGANPQMAAMKWMSYIMPIMFLFILNDYPAGLNYYYFVSTLISILTMLYLRKTTDETKLLEQLEARKKDLKTMKKSSFAARLEALQKQQEELNRKKQGK